MKADERKALETNVLADQLGRAMEGLKQPPPRSLLVYLVAAVVLVALVGAFRWFYQSSTSTESHRWVKLDEAVFPEQLTSLQEDADLAKSKQGTYVQLKEARLKLSQGLRDLGATPKEAHARLTEAAERYEKLAKELARQPLLHQEALSGAAKANETLGELTTAIELYKKLADEYPSSALGQDAKKSVARLESDDGRRVATELAKAFTPKN